MPADLERDGEGRKKKNMRRNLKVSDEEELAVSLPLGRAEGGMAEQQKRLGASASVSLEAFSHSWSLFCWTRNCVTFEVAALVTEGLMP